MLEYIAHYVQYVYSGARVTDVPNIYIYINIYNSRTALPLMWGSLRLAPTSDMQGMIWGEPEFTMHYVWWC